MKRAPTVPAFSLVEVTLALGIAAFCLIAVCGLIPVGVQTNRNATSQTAATSIIRGVVADLRATPKSAGTWSGTSSEFCIPLGTSRTLFFDNAGRCSTDLAGTTTPCGVSWAPPIEPRYQMNITFPSTGNLTYADVKVTWPAAATAADASGSIEMFAALDRR
jgi:Tfp pilus assembly protein PilV